MRIAKGARSGFTLMELIVVISIIILLAALTAGAVFRMRAGQLEKNTNTHLQKIHAALQQQWTAAVDRVKREDPPQLLKELTKNQDGSYDLARARAVHLKLRLRQEFPENFGDLMSSATLPQFQGQPAYMYAPKSVFKTAIKNPLMAGPNYVDPQAEAQSAAMLVLILSQGQGGTATTPESIAPTKLIEFPQNSANEPPIKLRVFADEWGNPIAFRRLADDDMQDVLRELNQPPYVTPAQVASGNMDPQDPEGRLRIQTWPGRNMVLGALAQPNQGSRPFIANPFDGLNRGPFVFSAGNNGLFYVPNTTVMENDLDNLYSFRLAQSGKGN